MLQVRLTDLSRQGHVVYDPGPNPDRRLMSGTVADTLSLLSLFPLFFPLSSPPLKPFFFSFSFLLSFFLPCDSPIHTRPHIRPWSLVSHPSIHLYLSRVLHLVAEETTIFILC